LDKRNEDGLTCQTWQVFSQSRDGGLRSRIDPAEILAYTRHMVKKSETKAVAPRKNIQ